HAVPRAPTPTLFPYTTLFRSEGGHVRSEGARLRLDPQISRGSPRTPRHPKVQPHPHEPRPQRLSGEPLLQPRGSHGGRLNALHRDRKSTRLNSSHEWISYAVF